jgi:hypothetical protein
MIANAREWLAGLSPDRRLLLGLLLLTTCLYSLLARDTYSGDFRAYYVAAKASHDGYDPYLNHVNVDERYADRDWLQQSSRFIYPPSSLFLFEPFSKLPYRTAKLVFATLMALFMVRLLFALSGEYPRANWITLALFLTLPMAANIDNGQVDILILTLTLAAFYERRSWFGGACLGVAIAVKLSPVLVLLWLATRRRWATAAWAIGTSALLTLLAVRVWGVAMYREFLTHLRFHLGPNPPMLTHTFHDGVVVLGRFVVMGTNTYALHYFYGTRQNPLLALKTHTVAAGVVLVLGYVAWLLFSPRGRRLSAASSFFAFLVVALFANTYLWPAGLIACFPLTLLLVQRARKPIEYGLLMLLPFYAPVEFIANRRFLFWLLAAGWVLWANTRQKSTDTQQKDLTQEVLA